MKLWLNYTNCKRNFQELLNKIQKEVKGTNTIEFFKNKINEMLHLCNA